MILTLMSANPPILVYGIGVSCKCWNYQKFNIVSTHRQCDTLHIWKNSFEWMNWKKTFEWFTTAKIIVMIHSKIKILRLWREVWVRYIYPVSLKLNTAICELKIVCSRGSIWIQCGIIRSSYLISQMMSFINWIEYSIWTGVFIQMIVKSFFFSKNSVFFASKIG